MDSAKSSAPKKRVVAVLPSVEPLDGTGGAVATWICSVFPRNRHSMSAVAVRAAHTEVTAVTVRVPRVFGVVYIILQGAARLLSVVTGRSTRAVYSRMIARDAFWPRQIWRSGSIRSDEIVYVHNRPKYVMQLRRLGCPNPIVLHMHNSLSNYINREEFQQMQTSLSAIAFCSEFIESEARSNFNVSLPTYVIANGVDPVKSSLSPVPSDGEAKLIFAGRIVPQKGVREALLVCDEVNKSGLRASIEIVGGTESGLSTGRTNYLSGVIDHVQEINVKYGDGTANYVGPISHRDVLRAFEKADFFVFPCQWDEPFGMVAIEAMSRGCVPIVIGRGGLTEIVSGVGLVVSPESANPVSEMAAFISELSGDPSLLSSTRQECISRAREYSWDRVALEVDQMIDEVSMVVGDDAGSENDARGLL